MRLEDSLRPNQEEVAARIIDGEAILINLSNGIYYSLDRVGALVWEVVERGSTLSDVVAAVCGGYEVSDARARTDVERLVAELASEGLVRVSSEGRAPEGEGGPTGPRPRKGGQRAPYEPPTLNIYRDMGDLLALDPPAPGIADIARRAPEG